MQPSSASQQSQRQVNVDVNRANSLTCNEDCSDNATAVCGRCGIPLCSDHQNEQRDPMFSDFSEKFRYFLLAIGLVAVIPIAWTMLDPVTMLEEEVLADQEDISVPDGSSTTVLHSSVLLGLGLWFALWAQSADRKTSARFLWRTPPRRTLCRECSADARVPLFILYAVSALAALLVLLGVYLAWSSSGVTPLRLSALGLAVYIVRTDAVMLIGKLVE
jgi:hypothetical protein